MRKLGWMAVGLALAGCSTPEPEPDNVSLAAQPTNATNTATADEPAPAESVPAPARPAAGHPCRTQDGEPMTHRLKALGTEPFWAAEVDGRCVTYKTPEDQQGTRIWTRVESGPQGPAWNGALRGRQFQLYVKPAPPPGCSDGMSDKTYPMDAVLRVDGEVRNGCAEPL